MQHGRIIVCGATRVVPGDKVHLRVLLLQGFEIGSGFEGSTLLGSEHNDEFYMTEDGQIRTRTNRYGGMPCPGLATCDTQTSTAPVS